MNKNKFLLVAVVILSVTSCAHRSQEKTRSISNEINNFKDDTHRAQIDEIILERRTKEIGFLEVDHNQDIRKWIQYFSVKDKERFTRYLKNGVKYKEFIQRTFREHKLPEELFYVGLIESGYYLKAKSRANAVGPWQFIKSTAKRYGLIVNSKVDERRNITKSTRAAALYFQDLYNIFGSWELALSAYNAGEYGVIRRIRKANTRDFYELSKRKKLPRETRNYVPKVVAAMTIAENPDKYRIRMPLTVETDFTHVKELKLKKSYRLRDLARITKTPLSKLKKLNNDLNGSIAPFKRKSSYALIIPQRTVQPTSRALSSIKEVKVRTYTKKKSPTRFYKVRRGDNLTLIARKFGTSISKIKKSNKLRRSKIFPGMKLKIETKAHKVHIVSPGDYLIKIAKKYKTTVAKIRSLNKGRLNRIYPGQRIIIRYN